MTAYYNGTNIDDAAPQISSLGRSLASSRKCSSGHQDKEVHQVFHGV